MKSLLCVIEASILIGLLKVMTPDLQSKLCWFVGFFHVFRIRNLLSRQVTEKICFAAFPAAHYCTNS